MLALAPDVAYVHEPFNPGTQPGISSAPFDHNFTVVTAENEARYLPGLKRTLALDYALGAEFRHMRTPRDLARSVRDSWSFELSRRARKRPVVKDPIALLSAEWLAERFGMDVVVLVRHPAGFAASLNRLVILGLRAARPRALREGLRFWSIEFPQVDHLCQITTERVLLSTQNCN